MITTKDLIAKGFIEIDDDITFRTHADVLRLFGRDHKVFQRAFAKHPHEEGVHIWFPIFYQDDENGWVNTFDQKEEKVFERRVHDNEGYLNEILESPQFHKRILFAKIERFSRIFYRYKGEFKFDADLSRSAKKAVYRRTANTTRLYLT